MTFPLLEYFYFESCPFCQMVAGVIQKHNIKVSLLDIWDDRAHAERLVQDTGRKTVPCLYIDGAPMHESSDIINWIESNLDKLEKSS